MRADCIYSTNIMTMRPLSDLETKLITELRINGRASISHLAETLGVTRATITKKMDALESEGIIVGYTVRTTTDSRPDEVHAISMVALERKNATQAIADLRGVPEVMALHTTNGSWDLVLEVTCRNLADFDRVLHHIRSVAGVVNTESSLLLRTISRL